MENKKRIKVFKTFQELEEDSLRQSLAMTLEERWEAFWKMKKNHKQLFSDENNEEVKSQSARKRIIISKPGWM